MKSYIIHKDWSLTVHQLIKNSVMSKSEAGDLLNAIFVYQLTGEIEEDLPNIVVAVLNLLIDQFRRDEEKYHKKVERNRENGKKGGRPVEEKITQENPKNPVGYDRHKPNVIKKGCRLPDEWKPSDNLIEWFNNEQKERKITLDIPDVTFEFCNYWHSKAGANATKLDWDKTFQVWVIKQFQYASKYKQPEKTTAQKPADYYDTSKNKYFIERD